MFIASISLTSCLASDEDLTRDKSPTSRGWKHLEQEDTIHSHIFNYSSLLPFAENYRRLAKTDVGIFAKPSQRLQSTAEISWANVSQPKYFYELSSTYAVRDNIVNADHIDARYYNEDVEAIHVNNDIRAKYLSALMSAWSRFTTQTGIVTWINHGTMLGWFWNGKLLPWDEDIDVQMLYSDLPSLAALNGTIFAARYLVDVSRYTAFRLPTGRNTIDARFIDLHSGLFVDITALVMKNGKLTCKSPHVYDPDDLFPLHLTLLGDAAVFRPHRAMKILANEYGEKSMVNTNFGKYSFSSVSQLWIEEDIGQVSDYAKRRIRRTVDLCSEPCG
jgi:LicD family